MTVKMEKLEKTVVKLEIEVSPEKFEEGMAKAFKANANKFNVNGFRKGKAPRAVVEKIYGEGVLYEDALSYIIPGEYFAAVKELDITPVEEPKYDVKEISKNKLVFTAEVTLEPEVKLGEYKGVSVEEISDEVTEEEIQKELDKVADQNSRIVSVTDRAAQNGDTAVIDYKGSVDGVEFEGGSAEGHALVLGSGQFIPGFEEQIIGANVGAEIDVNVTFPAEYQADELAGKAAIFKVKVNEIKAKEVPEINDEFASDVSEFETLNEYKESLKTKLAETKKVQVSNMMKNAVVEKAALNAEVEVPKCMIDNRVSSQINRYEDSLKQQGITLDQYFQFTGSSREEFMATLAVEMEKNIKETLVLEAICKAENIVATEAQIEEMYEKLAQQYKMSIEEIKKAMNEENQEYYESAVKIDNTIEFLLENAVKTAVTEKKTETKAAKPAKKTTKKAAVTEEVKE